jgi:hypothetical protein
VISSDTGNLIDRREEARLLAYLRRLRSEDARAETEEPVTSSARSPKALRRALDLEHVRRTLLGEVLRLQEEPGVDEVLGREIADAITEVGTVHRRLRRLADRLTAGHTRRGDRDGRG